MPSTRLLTSPDSTRWYARLPPATAIAAAPIAIHHRRARDGLQIPRKLSTAVTANLSTSVGFGTSNSSAQFERRTCKKFAQPRAQPGRAPRRYTDAVASRDDWQRRLGPLYGGAVALVQSTPWRWPAEVGDAPRT